MAEVERGDYGARKEKALEKVAKTLEECLSMFPTEEEQDNAREDIANYVIGYLGVTFGPHVKRR